MNPDFRRASGYVAACIIPALGLALSLVLTAAPVSAQPGEGSARRQDAYPDAPQLVVGIVIDQLRYDVLDRYWDDFAEDGFRRLINYGFSFQNARFDYMPTYTGPGHASIYTGTTPAVHGILGNEWYVRELDGVTYVTDDDSVDTVGSATGAGKMSPRWMLSTTIGDELRLHTNERARVIGLSLKDRGSILPAGHTGDAYWLDYETGGFITSTHYRNELPEWVAKLNARDLVRKHLAEPWETLLALSAYDESLPDDSPYEAVFEGEARPVFPHDLPALVDAEGLGLVAYTPFGDELVLELAIAALEGEALGTRGVTDLLAISFSSPDHIGHRFGPMSVEVQDAYLRLDRYLARLLAYLDEHIGRENMLVFLTSDHGVAHEPGYLEDRSIPVGRFFSRPVIAGLRTRLLELFGEDFVVAWRNLQVFLDRDRIRQAGLNLHEVQEAAALYMLEQQGIAGALTAHALTFSEFTDGHRTLVQRGFNARRSGDVIVWLEPQWLPMWSPTLRTTHGSAYSYDTRVPLIWYGWHIPAGRSAHAVYISDIASTLAVFINAPFPSGNTGTPMNELMR